jgi:hypothetical protein
MASETRKDVQTKVPVLGALMGTFLVYGFLRMVLHEFIGFDFPWEINTIIAVMILLISLIVGGSIGGLIQLQKQGRTAEIPSFLRYLLANVVRLVLLWAVMVLGDWLGETFYGRVGGLIGLVASGVLFFVVQLRFPRLSLE